MSEFFLSLFSFLPVSPIFFFSFFAFVIVAIAIDFLLLKNTGSEKIELKMAVLWSIVWVVVSLIFNVGLWPWFHNQVGPSVATQKATEFLTAYVVEKSLSIDNLFVFLTLFTLLGIAPALQKKVILIGVSGAIILRTIMVFVGLWLITQFSWILYVFGALLVLTGAKILYTSIYHKSSNEEETPALLAWIMRHCPISPISSEKLWIKKDNPTTPSFFPYMLTAVGLASICVVFVDTIFAVDSIPVVIAITQDPYIVLTSNILAILGLRALYFVLADLKDRFWALGIGLGVVLVFVGIKMSITAWYHINPFVSLAVIVSVIASSIVYAVVRPLDKTVKNK